MFKIGDLVEIIGDNCNDILVGNVGVVVDIDLEYMYPYRVRCPEGDGNLGREIWSRVKLVAEKKELKLTDKLLTVKSTYKIKGLDITEEEAVQLRDELIDALGDK